MALGDECEHAETPSTTVKSVVVRIAFGWIGLWRVDGNEHVKTYRTGDKLALNGARSKTPWRRLNHSNRQTGLESC